MLQLLTSRYNDRHWRKKIERTLSLSAAGVGDEKQRKIFLYLKHGLRAYKSRRADPDAWIVGGDTTHEVIARARHTPSIVGEGISKDDVDWLAQDPGPEVTEAWWDDMLVAWFEEPEDETAPETSSVDSGPTNEPARTQADHN